MMFAQERSKICLHRLRIVGCALIFALGHVDAFVVSTVRSSDLLGGCRFVLIALSVLTF